MCMWLCLSFCIAWCVCRFPHNQQRLLQTVTLELITETITEPPRLTLPPPPTKIHRLSILVRFTEIFARSFHVSISAEYITERPKYDIFTKKVVGVWSDVT